MLFKKYSDLYIIFNQSVWKPSYLDKILGIIHHRLSFFMDKSITDIKASDIKLWYLNINDVGNKSKRNYLSVLKGIFDIALHDEIINKNPMIHVKLPKYHAPRINPFTADDVKNIINHSKNYNYNFVYFLALGFYTGMRTGEILALKKSDVDLDKKIIRIRSTRSRFGESSPKTFGSIRDIPILDILFPYLKKMISLNDSDYMLTTQYNKPYRDSYVFTVRWWKPLLKSLNLEYRRPYNMRHTYATNMLFRSIVSPAELAQLLGHSNTQMVFDVYVSYLEKHFNNFDRSISIYT